MPEHTVQAPDMPERVEAYWRANVALIRNLLLVWAVVSYGAAILLGQALAGVKFFALPLSFWFAQQGSIVVFVILIFYYAGGCRPSRTARRPRRTGCRRPRSSRWPA